MMGHAPEEVREWASGFSPFSEEPNLGNRLDPRIKAGREQGLIDVALTGADVAGLGLAGLRGGVRAAYPTLNPEMNMSRREFMGNTGKAAAGLAAASAVPFALRGAEHAAPVVEHAAPVVEHAVQPGTLADRVAAERLAYIRADEASDGVFNNPHDLERAYMSELERLQYKIDNHPRFKDIGKKEDIRAQHLKEQNELYDEYDYHTHPELRHEFNGKLSDIRDRAIQKLEDYNAKHGILHPSEMWQRLANEPGFKYMDPETHAQFAFIKYDHKLGKWVPVENVEEALGASAPRDMTTFTGNRSIKKGIIDPHTGKASPIHQPYGWPRNDISGGYGPRRDIMHDLPKEYWEKYLRDRGYDFAGGGTITMPNNYRSGGRVRMI
jgi:hypothetical protein